MIGRAIGVALAVIGAFLIFWGYQSSNALASEISKTFTGSPTDQTLWYYIAGIACLVVGAGLAIIGIGGKK